jgi:Uma2 family endonuclease
MEELMLAHHPPYTIEDLFGMPEDGNRYEVLEGALIVSPSPDSWHQFFGDELRAAMQAAAPPGVSVITAITVRLGDDRTGLIPDIVVTTADLSKRPRLFDPAELLAVVEIVSPSSGSRDRVLKPDRYAAFGIPCYWRVELDPFPGQEGAQLPVILVHELEGGRYREVQRLIAGETSTAQLPYPVTLDPAAIL